MSILWRVLTCLCRPQTFFLTPLFTFQFGSEIPRAHQALLPKLEPYSSKVEKKHACRKKQSQPRDDADVWKPLHVAWAKSMTSSVLIQTNSLGKIQRFLCVSVSCWRVSKSSDLNPPWGERFHTTDFSRTDPLLLSPPAAFNSWIKSIHGTPEHDRVRVRESASVRVCAYAIHECD